MNTLYYENMNFLLWQLFVNNAAYMFNEETEEIELMHTEEDVEFQVFKYRVSHSH